MAAMVATQGIPMTVPHKYSFVKPARNYGKTEAIRQAGLIKEAAKALKISRREKKKHKLKGLRP